MQIELANPIQAAEAQVELANPIRAAEAQVELVHNQTTLLDRVK